MIYLSFFQVSKTYKYGSYNCDLGAKSKNHHYRIIELGHVSEASYAQPYEKTWEVTPSPAVPRRLHTVIIVCMQASMTCIQLAVLNHEFEFNVRRNLISRKLFY